MCMKIDAVTKQVIGKCTIKDPKPKNDLNAIVASAAISANMEWQHTTKAEEIFGFKMRLISTWDGQRY